MSTMYYTYPHKRPVGIIHSLGKDKGYHFTWCIFPMEFVESSMKGFCDEYDHILSFESFIDLIHHAKSQSFDERIE